MSDLLFGLGFVAVVEGLVLALLPTRLESLLQALSSIPPERLRVVGLGIVAVGVALVAVARS